MRLGELDITPVSDGHFKMPPQYFGQDDWGAHAGLAGPDGMLEIPIGCFLVRTGDLTVLIDAGLGPMEIPGTAQGGGLIEGLAAAGCAAGDVDLLLLTHLHLDHIGWTLQDGALTFPNATVRFGAQDLGQFIERENPDPIAGPMYDALVAAGRVEPIDSDGEVAPGISTLHAPGHTLGHRCIVLSSGDQRALLLGDAVTCPIQLEETDWLAMSDVDQQLAARTREVLFKELEGTDDLMIGAHFPGLEFGRVLRGEGKRYFS